MLNILVVFGSRHGSTAGVAKSIGEHLAHGGNAVTVLSVDQVTSVAEYDAVVIGTALRVDAVLPEVQAFVEEHAAALRSKPTAYFVLCYTLAEDTPEHRDLVLSALDPVRSIAPAMAIGLFAGALDYDRLATLERVVMRSKRAREGDYRDWPAVAIWANRLRADLRLCILREDEQREFKTFDPVSFS